MINTSATYRANINTETPQKWHVKGIITFANLQFYEFDDHDVWENPVKIQDSTSKPDTFEVGQAPIGQLTLTFQNFDGRFNKYDFAGAKIQLSIAMKLPDGTLEWINKGIFTVDAPVTVTGIMVITLSDNMIKFDRDYDSPIPFPCTLGDLLLDACNRCGVTLSTLHFLNDDYVVSKRPDGDATTYRDIVSYIAQLAGCWARINNMGQLVLGWYDMDRFYQDTGDVLSGGDFKDYSQQDVVSGGPFYPTAPTVSGGSFADYSQEDVVSGGNFTDYSQTDVLSGGDFKDYGKTPEDIISGGVFRQGLPAPAEITFLKSESVAAHDVRVTGVQIIENNKDKTPHFQGYHGYVVTVKDNPLVQDNIDTLVFRLAQKLVDFTFRPMEISALSDPSIEAGDVVWVTTSKGRFPTIVSNLTYSITDYESYSADAESDAENQAEHYGEAAKAVQEATRNVAQQITAADEINEMSDLIIGIYRTKQILDDGSEIQYFHDKPRLEDSQTIWKRTGKGVFLSRDGGKTYDYGLDSNGNAKFNQLWAMTLYANQIICGGSKSNAPFVALDDKDNPVLTINNLGLILGNGKKIIGGSGVISEFISESNGGFYGGFSPIGWTAGGGMPNRDFIYHYVYVPEDITITKATLSVDVMSFHLTDGGGSGAAAGWYTAVNISLTASNDPPELYYEGVYASEGSISETMQASGGKISGSKDHTNSIDEMAIHYHTILSPNSVGPYTAAMSQVAAADTNKTWGAEMTRTGNTGGSKPYSILPPNVVMNYEIYTGVFN